MVDISSQNNKINVTVSSSGNTANTNVTPDYAQYYSEKSKEWAISNRIVDNTDYSSKYYANESKTQADISTAKATEVIDSGNTAVSNIENARDNAILDVNTAGATQVALATEQATIATNKASEVIASGNNALSNIDTAKNNAITSITNQETTSKTSLIDEGATQVGLIQNEGATQVANVQSTGFYMRDDKLYYINSQGEETEFKLDDIELNNPYSLFDSKYSDHELFNLSWLVSNGSYNGSNTVHPSAYQALLVENNAEVAIGSTVTLPNGVKYTKQGLSVKLSTETYTDYDFVVNPADETFRPPIKPRNLNNTRYLIDAGKQDGIYYRIYADGYCEQWMSHLDTGTSANTTNTITFLKEFKDTNYAVIISLGKDDTNPDTNATYSATNKSVNGFQIRRYGQTSRFADWFASGYLAEGEYTPLADSILLYYYVGETVQNANLIDAGRIGEQLASLITIVETYQNGTSWYRVYSDGWCEQGGYSTSSNVTIKLLKTYANTNYTITLGKAFNDETNTRFPNIVSTTKTTAQFKVTGTYNNTTGTDCYFYWETKGYMV